MWVVSQGQIQEAGIKWKWATVGICADICLDVGGNHSDSVAVRGQIADVGRFVRRTVRKFGSILSMPPRIYTEGSQTWSATRRLIAAAGEYPIHGDCIHVDKWKRKKKRTNVYTCE